MAQRFATKGISVPGAGVTIPHGLGAVPDEYWFNQRGSATAYFPLTTAVDATNVYLTAAAAATADVFAAVNHSICK